VPREVRETRKTAKVRETNHLWGIQACCRAAGVESFNPDQSHGRHVCFTLNPAFVCSILNVACYFKTAPSTQYYYYVYRRCSMAHSIVEYKLMMITDVFAVIDWQLAQGALSVRR
jgi:hypothetical protein